MQTLRANGEGENALTNPNIYIRRRYKKLYEDYKAPYMYWKLVILTRKLCLAAIAILMSNPGLQVCVWNAVQYASSME